MSNLLVNANIYIQSNKGKVDDAWRPKYHLAGECGWINDPNGFIQFGGLYHQFYQHYPYDAVWGPMYWGHATSKDLIKWEYKPLALAPDRGYDSGGCFSGSAIEHEGKLHLMYTGVSKLNDKEPVSVQVQCLACSSDGVSFTKYQNNPVITTEQIPEGFSRIDFRDPRVFKRDGVFYSLIGSQKGSGIGQILLFKSEDLINWQFVNTILENDGTIGKGTWECPDLISLEDRDVLIFSPQYMSPKGEDFNNTHSSVYIVGNLDFTRGVFTGGKPVSLDNGFDFYAPQVLQDQKGRRIMTAWMDMWESPMPTAALGHNWAGAMILPREMHLKNGNLYFEPVEEIKNHRSNQFSINDVEVEGEVELSTGGDCYELEAVFENVEADGFGLKLRVGENEETLLLFKPEEGLIELDRTNSGKGPGGTRRARINVIDGRYRLRVFVDKSSVEVFVNNGEKVLSARVYPGRQSNGIKIFSDKCARLISLKKWDLII